MTDDQTPQEDWDDTDEEFCAAADAHAVQTAVQTGETLEEAIKWYGPLPGSPYQARFDEILKTMGLSPKTPAE